MKDWTGTVAQIDALTVPCRYCGSQPGEHCTVKTEEHRPLRAFPAHVGRIKDATKAREESA